MPEGKTLVELISQIGDAKALRAEFLEYLFKGLPDVSTLGTLDPHWAKRTSVMGQWDVEVLATVTTASGEWISMGPQVTIYNGGTEIAGPVQLNHFAGNVWKGVVHGCFPLPTFAKLEVGFTREENGQYVTDGLSSTENIVDA